MRFKRIFCILISVLFVRNTLIAATFQDLPTIASARLGVVDSKTYTGYLETKKIFERLIPVLKQELSSIKLAEMNIKMGIEFNEWHSKNIKEVFNRYGSQDPIQDFFKLRQYAPKYRLYDPEGKLYILDDIAHAYTYGLVNFRFAQQYNKQAEKLYKKLSKIGLENLPVSDYYNNRRGLYYTFFYRMTNNNPQNFNIFPGRIDWITPFPKNYLEKIRKIDFQRVGQRIKERNEFLEAKLGGKPSLKSKGKVPFSLEYNIKLLGRLKQFMNSSGEYDPFEMNFMLAREAYNGYRASGDGAYLLEIINYCEKAMASEPGNSLYAQNLLNKMNYWLGLSYIKKGETKRGIERIEKFLAGIDAFERLEQESFTYRKAIVEKISKDQIESAKNSAMWGKIFAFAVIAAGTYGAANTTAGGGLNQTQANQLQWQSMQTFGQGVNMLLDINSDLRADKAQAELRKEVTKFITPYSLKVNRYLDKFEMVDYFLEVGKGYEAQNQPEKALAQYEEAARIIERQRTTIFTERQRISFFAAKQELYDRIIRLLVSLERPDEALQYVERAKSRAFVDVLGSSKLKFESHDRNSSYQAALKTQAEIDTILSGKKIGNSQLNHLIDRAKRGIQVKKKDANFTADVELQSLSAVQTIKADEIKKMAGENTALLEYYLAENTLIVFLVQNNKIEAITSAIDHDKMLAEIREWRKKIENRQDPRNLSKNLYDLLVSPMASRIRAKRLIIVPYGVLHYIPFQALHNGHEYLIERYAISYAPSATVLSFTEKKKSAENKKALIIGNPTLDLGFAEKEAKNIAGLFQNRTLLTREKGTETFVRNNGGGYEFIHFATHGEYDDKNPLNSRILLRADTDNDGSLTMAELFSIKWQASLVTLSACKTGLSKYKSGDELIGLQRGLLFAGTRSIISSLWSVDDEATGCLMKSFYSNLSKMPKDVALQKAQIETMAQFENPFFWAAFNLTGASS